MQKKNGYEITKSLKASKEDAFRFLFHAYFESLEAFAQSYVKDEQVSKDLVQDAFYNLWKKRTSLPEDANIKAYLYQSTRNNCLNYLKRVRIKSTYEKKVLSSHAELELNMEALQQLNFDIVVFNELQQNIAKVISGLPPKCKEVFECSRHKGLKNKEIAELLNISEKAVEGHISKALKTLRVQLNERYPEEIILCILTHLC